jgi:hypothetical protein
MPTVPVTPGRLRKYDCKFKASLGNIARPCLKKGERGRGKRENH